MSLSRFGVEKPVPVNLLMTALLLGGVFCAATLRREFFPRTEPDQALVTLPYPGATPEEIEETLAIKVEDKLAELDEVDEMTTTLAEGGGGVLVEFRSDVGSVTKAVDEVERAMDALQDLPDEAERIQVREFEPVIPVVRLTLYGPVEERVLKRVIRRMKDELRSLPGMGDVQTEGVRDYEIRVDLDQAAVMQYGLSLPQVSSAIKAWMAEVPGGTVKGLTGNVKIRTMGVAERAHAIREIVLMALPDGRALRVADVATVTDDFVDEDLVSTYNGQPSASLTVYKLGDQDIVQMADMVKAYIAGHNGVPLRYHAWERWINPRRFQAYELGLASPIAIPPGAKLEFNSDYARFVVDRLELLTRNALQGAALVFLTLLIFLSWRSALWVFAGLATALAGTILLMWTFNVTLNLLTMFGLILVVGMLVDDGIVVAENIEKRNEHGEGALTAAIRGAEQVGWPVVATVTTTIVAFSPLNFIEGRIGDLMGALPAVVICALTMSLIESLLILPSHMGHSLAKRESRRVGLVDRLLRGWELARDRFIFDRVVPAYGRLLSLSLRYRYVSVAAALAVLIVAVGLVLGGRVKYVFLVRSDAETIIVDLRMPIGTPVGKTQEVVGRVTAAAQQQPETRNISAAVGQRANIDTGAAEAFAPHIAQMFIELQPVEKRDRESSRVIDSIRRELEGKLADIDRIRFSELAGGPGGSDITLEVRGNDLDQLEQAVRRIKDGLAGYEGVHDIADDNELGQREVQIKLKSSAAALGTSTADVATQVRGALYGMESHVFSDRGEDIKVRTRLDPETRRSLHAIENLWIIGPTGKPVPLVEVADLEEGLTYATLKRVDRQRTITVSADTAPGVSADDIIREMDLPALSAQFPGVEIRYGGKQRQQAEAFASLPYGMAAAFVMIYVILAWLFGSYSQPVAVMLAIPFSLIGVILGHGLLGYEMTFLSVIGFVALSGIVVNDSLILMEFYNHQRAKGHSLFDAMVEAGRQRLRPIFLTTITTILGLMPLILEQSFQAKFLIPMAISVSGGLASATVLVLLVLPCVTLIVDDVKAVLFFLWNGMTRTQAAERERLQHA